MRKNGACAKTGLLNTIKKGNRTMKNDNKKKSLKKQLKKYSQEQIEAVNETVDFVEDLIDCLIVYDCDSFERNSEHLLSLEKKMGNFPKIVSLLNALNVNLSGNFDEYLDNLREKHPDCFICTREHPNGIFKINCAEKKEKAKRQVIREQASMHETFLMDNSSTIPF